MSRITGSSVQTIRPVGSPRSGLSVPPVVFTKIRQLVQLSRRDRELGSATSAEA
jgi:hypothetical protein